MESKTLALCDRSYRTASSEIWLTVLWSGNEPGGRSLILPNEELVAVAPTVFFTSSHDTFCNFTSEIVRAGRIYPIELGYNITVSLMFSFNGSEVVYNVYTYQGAVDYEPKEITVSLEEYWRFAQDVSLTCLCFGALAGFLAIKVRGLT